MRKAVRRGKLRVVREGGERLSLGGGMAIEARRAVRTFSSPLVCIADSGAEVGGGAGNSLLPPPQLYKYAAPDLARIRSVIVDGQVYFANPLDFNDPFDCRMSRPAWSDNPEAALQRGEALLKQARDAGHGDFEPLEEDARRRILNDPEYRENHLRKKQEGLLAHFNMGVCCLTANEKSVQMWAHYAKNHTGVCYKFNMSGYELAATPESGGGIFPFSIVLRVDYLKVFPLRERMGFKPQEFPAVPAHFVEKHEGWKYEQEWRAFMFDSKVSLRGQRLPAEMSAYQGAGLYRHQGTLDGVLLGRRIETATEQEVISMANLRGLGVWKMIPKVNEYDFDLLPRNRRAEEEDAGNGGATPRPDTGTP